MQLPHLSGVESCCDGPTQFLAILSRVGQAGAHPFSQDVPFEFGKNSQQTGHRPACCCCQVERLGDRHEPDTQLGELFQSYDQIDQRAAPTIQPPNQHDIDFAAARGGQQFFAEFTLGRAGTNLSDLDYDGPTARPGILAHGADLQRKRLLIVRGHAGVEAGAKHFA